MKVKIWSDTMCPFCYIAKKNFEKAMQQLSFAKEIEVEWKSYQLDPELQETSGSTNFGQYLMERKGFSVSKKGQFLQQLTDMGESSGVNFNFDKTYVANTFLAHKLLHLAKKYGKNSEMEELLFQALFENGMNIADPELLISLAEQLEIDKTVTREALVSNKVDYEVKQDFMEARNMAVSSVPFFVLDNKYSISGAQPVEVFLTALTQSYNENLKSSESIEGSNCSC
ncbi:DsbA family oxidoreductase [Kiloniella sp.]|uniref:DsbA family oxidoreductase n=1 Tax=Kiloniella sp. TaxID=1938587 RepID=UPI003A8CF5B3